MFRLTMVRIFMNSLPVSKFKATCLAVLEEVRTKKKRVLITKRGKPIAEVVPVGRSQKRIPLKDTVTFLGDIVSPVAEDDWEAREKPPA
jgi:prevent-host-death family protein